MEWGVKTHVENGKEAKSCLWGDCKTTTYYIIMLKVKSTEIWMATA